MLVLCEIHIFVNFTPIWKGMNEKGLNSNTQKYVTHWFNFKTPYPGTILHVLLNGINTI